MGAIRASGKKNPVIAIDEDKLRTHVSEFVRLSVDEILNSLLDVEADTLCHTSRYERNVERPVPALVITSGICIPRLEQSAHSSQATSRTF